MIVSVVVKLRSGQIIMTIIFSTVQMDCSSSTNAKLHLISELWTSEEINCSWVCDIRRNTCKLNASAYEADENKHGIVSALFGGVTNIVLMTGYQNNTGYASTEISNNKVTHEFKHHNYKSGQLEVKISKRRHPWY